MKSALLLLLFSLFLIPATISVATRPHRSGGDDTGIGGFLPPGAGFNIPGLGPVIGGGYGSGYGSPKGGHSKSGVIRPTVVCKVKGPCLGKKLRCPAKCFSSYGRSGKGYGYGGGGGGCTMDCQKKCIAYCWGEEMIYIYIYMCVLYLFIYVGGDGFILLHYITAAVFVSIYNIRITTSMKIWDAVPL